MLLLYTLKTLIICICIIIVIGILNFKENIKRYILMISSIIYNCFIGYIDTYVILILYGYFANMPKGSGYEVPESEADFNFMLGLITLVIYLILLVPINIYMKKKGKINSKIYKRVTIISTIIGIIIFWIFLDKSKKLF